MRAIGSQLGICTWGNWASWAAANGCQKGWRGGLTFSGDQTHLDAIHNSIFRSGKGVRVRIADLPEGTFPTNQVFTRLLPVEDLKSLDEAYLAEPAVNSTSIEADEEPLRPPAH